MNAIDFADSNKMSGYKLVAKYNFKDCFLLQFNLSVLSHYSYIIVSDNEALLVDVGRDIGAYKSYLESHNLKCIGVFLTHSHADFVAGHCEVAKDLKVPILISAAANVKYKHISIYDDDLIKLGKVDIRFIETPGHTLDGMCAVVENDGQPQFLITGDTLFVGGVGRPDLMSGNVPASELAAKSYASWQNKLSQFQDDIKFFPAHGAGSLCGSFMGDMPFSTIAEEKKSNPIIKAKSRSEFIAKILTNLAQAPQYFKYDASLNQAGPDLVVWDKPIEYLKNPIGLDDFQKYQVVDVRNQSDYLKEHIANSLNIGINGKFETFVGIFLSHNDEIVIIGDSDSQIKEAIWRLHRIGYCAKAVLISEVDKDKNKFLKNPEISPKALYERIHDATSSLIVDVRSPIEADEFKIPTQLNVPLNEVSRFAINFAKNEPITLICASGYRSNIAVGLLERNSIKNISVLKNGVQEWRECKLPNL